MMGIHNSETDKFYFVHRNVVITREMHFNDYFTQIEKIAKNFAANYQKNYHYDQFEIRI